MSGPERHALLKRLLTSALESQPAAQSSHVAEDDDLLSRFDQDLLSPQERDQFLEHLADCSRCRQRVAELVRAGAIVPAEPAPPTSTLAPSTPVAERPLRATYRRRIAVAVVAAAALLSAVFLGVTSWNRGTSDDALALAQKSLAAGRPQEALDHLAAAQSAGLDPARRQEYARAWEEATYLAGRSALAESRFPDVTSLVQKATKQAGVGSGRLVNLDLQAQRRVPADVTLAARGSLLDYGYEPTGLAPAKGLPTLDETTDRLVAAYESAIAANAKDVILRINFGQFLLTLNRFGDARTHFAAASQLDETNGLAHLGLGMVAFELGEIDEARGHFEKAAEVLPDSVAIEINLALCWERLKNPQTAQRHWQRAWTTTREPRLRDRIFKRAWPALSEPQDDRRRDKPDDRRERERETDRGRDGVRKREQKP
ncbi:MAG: zf-HC2 domain-containing protein [Planctomycetia bacterium]|nr:zf-HC2 domain-containing protein [Planctomycetia bacterium]